MTTQPPAPDRTADELRVAVARCLGWTQCTYPNKLAEDMWYHADSPLCPDGHYIGAQELPDWPNDLNLCATFEATLTEGEEWMDYCGHLQKDMEKDYWGVLAVIHCCRASALQRCRAFLVVKEGR